MEEPLTDATKDGRHEARPYLNPLDSSWAEVVAELVDAANEVEDAQRGSS